MRALVLQGGGMRGAFVAGVLAGLRNEGIDYSFFDHYVGSSAGACSMGFFVTNQVEEGLRMWQDCLPRNFMKWRGFRPYNDLESFDGLIREVFGPQLCAILRGRKQKAFVALSNPATLRDDYICLNETTEDPVRVLVAAVAAPLLSGPVTVNGQPYYDGTLTAAIPLRHAESSGADEIWVVLTTPAGYRRKTLYWKAVSWLALHNPPVRQLLANRAFLENRTLDEIERRTDIVVTRPEESLPVHWRNNDRAAIKATVEIGKATARKVLAESGTRLRG